MASPQASDKLGSNLKVTQYDFDPNTTGVVEIAWVDMRDYHNLMVTFFRTIGTANLTFTIIGNAESAGGGSDVEIKSWSGSEPVAVGDYVVLECTAEEMAQEASDAGVDNLRYLTAVVAVATAEDEGVVTYIRGGAKRAADGLTVDVVA